MASLREIKDRIGSVRSTLKITSAMKLVASAKLRKAQKAIEGMRPYENALTDILFAVQYGGISPEPPAASSPFSTLRQQNPGAGRSADADFAALKSPARKTPSAGETLRYDIQARIARLNVEFRVGDGCFTEVYLTGPADEIR